MCSGPSLYIDVSESACRKLEQLKEELVKVGACRRAGGKTTIMQQMLEREMLNGQYGEELAAALKQPRQMRNPGPYENDARHSSKALSARRARNKAARKARKKQR